MKITLFLMDRIKEFILPAQISGSFSFDENENEESKLINIDARENTWILYSTNDVSIINNNRLEKEVKLENFRFYILRRNNKNYVIYASPTFENTLTIYSYDKNLDLIIGNSNDCNIIYNLPYINNLKVNIKVQNNNIVLQKDNNSIIYINKIGLKTPAYYIKNGDCINIYGMRLLFLPNMIIINNPANRVMVNEMATKITKKIIEENDNYDDKEIKDIDLYNESSYFSKSPRIRRIIETKRIKIDEPPNNEHQDLPLILTLGPMITMGAVSMLMLAGTISSIAKGETTLKEQWVSLMSEGLMLVSMLVWPLVTDWYNKRLRKKKEKEILEKYTAYLETKKEELVNEQRLQKEILIENLITIPECINMIRNKNMYFWDKRIEQNDFLVTRLGMGKAKLDIEIDWPEKGFTIDETALKKKADELIESFKYIDNVPVAYSFSKNKITAIMGNKVKAQYFVDNILLQLLTFYSYDDLKIVLFTNENNKERWKYLKYLNHTFDNNKNIRFFCSNIEEIKEVCQYLEGELSRRAKVNSDKKNPNSISKPHYLLVVDDYSEVKKTNFMKTLTEIDASFGFSLIIIEKSLSKLPSKCVNFIQLGEKESGILQNSYEKQEICNFYDEINYGVNMLEVSKILSNIPIEFENSAKQLPESINFLEMEKVGKVEQLNVLNRWNTNDPTTSLKAEIGVNENGDYMYLDLHEKFHGPHGLIAGTTGSGKSEFIITYILSLSMNYSPDEVSFILIDYKGGGLALAFENKTTGVYLPHLAGTITNLDKAEMDRTLVSIDSEVKRRQLKFNAAREQLGESTIDIYKYQKFYREGKLEEPIPHLFIICDEFAELKSQQPDFMQNLISIARIGRSLGVHLILATQKPSGVVDDQIWSNSKFKVCLKVQDTSDSNEMIKREDAAWLKQAGRFYLQVGYDEYFALGQSAWCGAKYYPSDKIIKPVDKSLRFIDNIGRVTKSIESGNNIKIKEQGDQISNILNNIVAVSNQVNKKSKRLWLPNIDPIILVDNLIDKYNVETTISVEAILGEYDAPEKQEQGLLKYSFLEEGNTVIFGNDAREREMLLGSIIYSTSTLYTTKNINYYIVDYGAETLRKYEPLPQVGDIIFLGEDEKFTNLFKMINKELSTRKKLFAEYGGEYINYLKNAPGDNKLPIISIILNNFDGILEIYQDLTDELIPIVRDCARYGIIFIITINSDTLYRRLDEALPNRYAFKLSDTSEYRDIFTTNKRIEPRKVFGRGLVNNGEVHEFQAASLLKDQNNEIKKLKEIGKKLEEFNPIKVPKIPSLPDYVTYDLVKDSIDQIENVPIGIIRDGLEIEKYDFTEYSSTNISSNKFENMNEFINSLIKVFTEIKKLEITIIDPLKLLSEFKDKVKYYIDIDFDDNFEKINENLDNDIKDSRRLLIMYGVEKTLGKLSGTDTLEEISGKIKKSENTNIVFIDAARKLKSLDYDDWYSSISNSSDGIWIGKGMADQSVFSVSSITSEMSKKYSNSYGFCVKDQESELIKLLDFNEKGELEDEE